MNRFVQRQAAKAMLLKTPSRQFSLLVPLQTKQSAPAELTYTPLTDAAFAQLQASY
jgi:hypothetical protein